MAECGTIEPCHDRDCDGYDEVLALLPPGKIWNPARGGTYGNYIRALGDIKTELNKRICQEYRELNPCTAERLLPYWIRVYSLPACVEQTAEKLCEWIELLQGVCPIGSLGFLRRAIEFVAPGKGITIDVTYPELGANCPCPDSLCATDNPLIVTAPPEAFYYETLDSDEPREWQDGENCRVYFIPEIECLRPCIFPFGLGVGYQTSPIGPDGQDIYGVPDANELARTQWQKVCDGASTVFNECQFNYRPPVAPASATISGVELTGLSGTFGQFTGNVPMVLTASGLPAGVTFTDNGDGSWTLGGAFPIEGSYSYQVTGTNPFGTASSTNSIIATASVVCIAPTAPALADLSGVQGGALNYTSPAWTGTAPIALSVTGLPSGMTFADNGDGTFTLGGVYPADGTYTLTVTGTNACGADGVVFDVVSSAAPSWVGPPLTLIKDDRSATPGNAANARVYLGDVAAVHPGLFVAGPGMVNGGIDTSISGGAVSATDPSPLGTAGLRATYATASPTLIRISYASGDAISSSGVWPSLAAYAPGGWVAYTPGEAIFVDCIALANSSLNDRTTVVLLEADIGGTVISANVKLRAIASDGSPLP